MFVSMRGRFFVALVGVWDLFPYAKHLFSEANLTGAAWGRRAEAQLGSGPSRDGEDRSYAQSSPSRTSATRRCAAAISARSRQCSTTSFSILAPRGSPTP